MDQLHKRFTDEQIKVLFQLYCQGLLRRDTVQEILRISKSQLFVLLKRYRQYPESFTVSYKRATPPRLSVTDEAGIERALLLEQEIVEDKRLPIYCYNYTAMRDRLAKKGINISVTISCSIADNSSSSMPP